MPHVVYLHSALTQRRIVGRDDEEKKRILGFERVDVVIALSLAGAGQPLDDDRRRGALPHQRADRDRHDRRRLRRAEDAGLRQRRDVFGIALLASGFASSSVGTMAGQVVMQGFIRRSIPLFLRRAITLAPALVVLARRLQPDRRPGLSQVVLSFGIPFALVPLLMIARRRDIMGSLANPGWLTALAAVLAALIIALNVFLIADLFL